MEIGIKGRLRILDKNLEVKAMRNAELTVSHNLGRFYPMQGKMINNLLQWRA